MDEFLPHRDVLGVRARTPVTADGDIASGSGRLYSLGGTLRSNDAFRQRVGSVSDWSRRDARNDGAASPARAP